MFIKRKYKVRHQILGALQGHYNKFNRPDDIDTSAIELSWSELTAGAGLKDDQLLEHIDHLLINGEIYNNENNYNSSYLILQKGTTAFYDRKYIEIGNKEARDLLYDRIKIVSAIVLLVIAVFTFLRNVMATEKNTLEIERLKNEVKTLKANK